MKLVAEIGSCFQPGKPYSVIDAARRAMEAGADMVKLQVFRAEALAYRRGRTPETLRPFEVPPAVTEALARANIPFGVTLFGPFPYSIRDTAFYKVAAHEWQYAVQAQTVCEYAHEQSVPLIVSVPPDACLAVGNYWSAMPITWLHCVPAYPAHADDYHVKRMEAMKGTMPGNFGVSDHTPDCSLFNRFMTYFGGGINVWEKHFCYDEALRSQVPDGGPWSVDAAELSRLARLVHDAP